MGGRGGERRVVVVACLGGGLSALDSAVNIAFPAIIEAFGLGVSSLQWVIVSYVLTYAALLLPFGRLADQLGHGRVLAAGLVVSAVALTACAAAPTFPVLLVARVAQGVGIALVLAAAPALITLAVPEETRARALAGFQMSIAVGFAAGPLVGGLLLELGSWRTVYLFRVPVALAILALAAAGLRRDVAPARARAAPTAGALDLPGAATFAVGLASLLLVASRGSALGWASPLTVALLVLAAGALVAFVVRERRAPLPLVDLSLFRHPTFAVANVLNWSANGTMFVIWLLGPTLLVTVRGHVTIPGGLLLAVTAVATAVAARLAGRVIDRVGTGTLSTLGLALQAAGLAVASRLGADTPTAAVVTAFALVGAGLGLFQVPNLSYVMGSIPRTQQGVAGSMAQMVRTAGIVSGVAAANALFVVRRDAYAGALGGADPTSAGVFVPAFRDVLLAAAVVCAGAAALSLVRRSRRGVPGPPLVTRR